MTRRALVAVLLAGCGGDGDVTPDAALQGDAPAAKVVALASCPVVVDATITSTSTAFSPMQTTVLVTAIVKFVMTDDHTVIPNTLTTTDPVLMVGMGQTKCFQFKAVGTYGIACGTHSFPGTIVVQ